MKTRITAIFLICIAIFPLFLSCNGSKTENQPTEPGTLEDVADAFDAPQTEIEYIYPELNCNGEDFTILNSSNVWAFYYQIVQETMTGDVLDDAIYVRNRAIEEKFNVNIKEVPVEVTTFNGKLRTIMLSGDDLYDAAFAPCNDGSVALGTLITENMLHNLKNVPGLNLGEPWWNQSAMATSEIGSSKRLYFAFSDIDIFTLQGAWCMFINEAMIENLGLERPYELVKNGKWTYDRFYEYMRAGAQLGGADSFKWEENGPAVYGYTSFVSGTRALLAGSGERFTEMDGSGTPYITFGSERFYNVCERLGEILGTKAIGGYENANNYGTPYHFEAMFENNRAFMMAGELKAANSIRNMETAFGIMPMPKYDEAQERYWTTLLTAAPVMVIPTTHSNLERSGIIMDAMAYLSTKDIIPVFFDVTMSQKQLRNTESIEMLQLIRDTQFLDIGNVYGVGNQLNNLINSALDAGKSDTVASSIEKNEANVQDAIEKLIEYINNMD